jgi:Holliday junction resolvase
MNHAARRQKGSRGERELAKLLNERFDLGASRNLTQTREGGEDINLNAIGICIEVKRQEALSVNTWWKQISNAAAQASLMPVLAYRQNRKKWKFVLPATLLSLEVKGKIEVDEDVFFVFLENWISTKQWLTNSHRMRILESQS